MLFREQSRPFDPTGNALLNLILAEHRQLTSPNDRIFIPTHGPYYTKSLLVTNGGVPLVRGIDYECILFYKEATTETGKEVGCGIKIKKTGISNVTIDYQVVGGKYQFVFPVLKSLMENLGEDLINPILYNAIIGKPDTFPPSAHRHPYWKFDGWGVLIEPMDRILNGIYYQDRAKYRSTYDYWYTKQGQFENILTNKVRTLRNSIEAAYLDIREPVGTIRLRTGNRDMGLDRDGVWVTESDKVLAFTETDAEIGNEYSLSEEIVYPQPDNILLDEQNNPILTDIGDWIYLDNEHPIVPAPTGDYGEPVDEQFDMLHIRGYRKTLNGNVYDAYVSASSTATLQEGQSVTFTLHTNKFDVGLVIPYQITGINDANITIPKYGTVTLGAGGIATLTLTLVPGSPRTDATQMEVEFLVNGGTTFNLNYNLAANATYRLKAYATTGYNDMWVDDYVVGDIFMLRLSQHGLSNRVVRISAAFDAGAHQIRLNNLAPVGGYFEFTMPADGSDLYIPVTCTPTSGIAVSMLNFNISYNGNNLDSFALPSSLLNWQISWRNLTNNDVITTIGDEVPFTFDVTHSSRKPLTFQVTVTENTLGSEVSTIPSLVQSNYNGLATAGRIMIGRNNRVDPDRLTIQVRNPYMTSDTKSITLTVPAVV